MKFSVSNKDAIRLVEAFGKVPESVYMNRFYAAFGQYFKDRCDFESCLNNLNSEKNKIARLGYFYDMATKEIGHAAVVLIAIFSIMEATSQEDFQPFDQWLLAQLKGSGNISFPIKDKSNLKNLILSLQIQYSSKHGSSKKVHEFISNHFSDEDKQNLIAGFQIKNEHINNNLLSSEDKVKVTVDMLYNERSAFVHSARLSQITDQNVDMLGYLKVRNKNTYVTVKISINEIKSMFEKAFIKLIRERGLFNLAAARNAQKSARH